MTQLHNPKIFEVSKVDLNLRTFTVFVRNKDYDSDHFA